VHTCTNHNADHQFNDENDELLQEQMKSHDFRIFGQRKVRRSYVYMRPNTAIYVLGAVGSAVSVGQVLLHMCPHTTTYVFSYYYICVLILLYMYPRATIYVSSY
jgi:hypothetical protein